MKKIVVLVACATVALLLIVFGPALLDLYRLINFVEASTEAYEANGPWPQLADVCTGCHGAEGNSLHQAYPSLAGQPVGYVASQLQHFAREQRADPNMAPLAMTLSKAEISHLSEYFSRQPVAPNRYFQPDPALQKQGQRLVGERGCAVCHGGRFMGQGQNPRLAAQGYDYLVAQLDAFATGTRVDPIGAMNGLASSIPPEERKAMAHYLAGLVPATHTSTGLQE